MNDANFRGFLIQKAADEATIRQLNEDLSAHKIHVECLTSKLGLIEFDVESRCENPLKLTLIVEIQSCLSCFVNKLPVICHRSLRGSGFEGLPAD